MKRIKGILEKLVLFIFAQWLPISALTGAGALLIMACAYAANAGAEDRWHYQQINLDRVKADKSQMSWESYLNHEYSNY